MADNNWIITIPLFQLMWELWRQHLCSKTFCYCQYLSVIVTQYSSSMCIPQQTVSNDYLQYKYVTYGEKKTSLTDIFLDLNS